MHDVLFTSVEEGDRSHRVGRLSKLAGIMALVSSQRVVYVPSWSRRYNQHQQKQLRRRPYSSTYTTRHTASTSMYLLTFCVRFLLAERHQWKPAFQTAAVMLRTPPVGGRSPAGRPLPLPVCSARFWGRPPSPAGRRPATRADPAQPAVRTMSTYRRIDASL